MPQLSTIIPSHLITITCLVLIIGSSTAEKNDWDYLQFVQEWPPVTCLKYKDGCSVPNSVKTFTIHGLWPQRNDGSWPEFCVGGAWNYDVLVPIHSDMDLLWPSFLAEYQKFWDHEWTKHGTCVASSSTFVTNQFEYFLMTLNLRYRFNFFDIMREGGIVPDAKRGYSIAHIEKVLKKNVGVSPRIVCHEKKYLHGIWMCIDKDFKFIDCPKSTINRLQGMSGSCLEKVEFLPLNQTILS